MVDQTKDRIQEVQTANHAKIYEENTKKLIDKWISKCPVKFVKKEEIYPGFVYPNGEIIITITKERK
tara:strand:+ start:297 stop:497 length:201 start_codon:yes stop_codon:yes gene_type:complete